MNLRKDLVKVDVNINGKSHTYNYHGAGEDLKVEIRGTDVRPYERSLRKADLEYNKSDKLQVYVTYKIQIKNQSQGSITGYILDLNDYADTSYELIRSYDENNQPITWSSAGTVTGSNKTYNKLSTKSLANTGITDKKWIFMEYRVKDEALGEVLNKGHTTEENFAEIAGYRNTYTYERKDTEGRVMSSAGENAGLIDKDSIPDNMNPTSSNVQEFVKRSRTEQYQNSSGDVKTAASTAVFEDDADVAPGLDLILSNTARTISGTVFEDLPLEEKLRNNERIGNGAYEGTEPIVNGVTVELICTNNEDVNTITTYSKSDGTYTISGYIPGDYIIKFTYGDKTCLKAVQQDNEMYTGQDYKSTIYNEGNYNNANWYLDSSQRNNDAKDNWDRRQEVNNYSKDYQYDKATLLNSTKNSASDATLQDLADKTNMNASTAPMEMYVEYNKVENINYNVNNIDFGIIERPRTKILLEKNVSHIKLTATDGTTIFDTTQKVPNLTWKDNEYDENSSVIKAGLVQGTIDENLLYGSTLNVTFSLKITNLSEKDYNEQQYYYTGAPSNTNNINKITTKSIIDYIPNVVQYEETLTKNNAGGSNIWNILQDKKTGTTIPEAEYKNKLIEGSVFDEATSKKDEILLTNLSGIQIGLKPGESQNLDNVLTCTRVIARIEDTENDDQIQNIAEIIKLTIDNGRRPYYMMKTEGGTEIEVPEIPGNANPITGLNGSNILELDTGMAEILTFVVPFGANRQLTLIVVAIVSLGILIAGIILIKKKVL